MKAKLLLLITPFLFTGFLYGESNRFKPVDNFKLDRYLGKWYEIGRYEHSFERGLEEVTAEYSLRDDGKVRVLNSGFSEAKNKRKSSEGYAIFAGDKNLGELKVTFFWPFFGAYRIARLSENYEYALVVGDNYDYLWILSRKPELDQKIINELLEVLKQNGFDTGKIHWVRQKKNP